LQKWAGLRAEAPAAALPMRLARPRDAIEIAEFSKCRIGPRASADTAIRRGAIAAPSKTVHPDRGRGAGDGSENRSGKYLNVLNGAANRTRTCDPVITNDVLYQLSYCGGPNQRSGVTRKRSHLISGTAPIGKKNAGL